MLIVLGRADVFLRIFSICPIFNLILTVYLSCYHGYIGTALSIIISQIIIAIFMSYYANDIEQKQSEKIKLC